MKVTCLQEGGSHCSICHQQFADGDQVCARGHIIGHLYDAPDEQPVQQSAPKAMMGRFPHPQTKVVCGQIGGSHCSICMAHFADGNTICNNGHQIGQEYPVVT